MQVPAAPPAPTDQPARVRARSLAWPLGFLAVGVVLAVAFCALYRWAVQTSAGQVSDINQFAALQVLNPTLGPVATVLRPGLIAVGAAACVVLGVAAVARGRWRSLTAAALVVVVSVASSRALKDLILERPYLGEHGYTTNTFPSGHVSASLALLVAIALLAPRWRSRRAAALTAVCLVVVGTVACGVSLLEHVHRPSDVLGSVLLVGAVTAFTLAALRPSPPIPEVSTGQPSR